MLRPIRKVEKRKNRFSVNSQNLLYTIFCESTVSNVVDQMWPEISAKNPFTSGVGIGIVNFKSLATFVFRTVSHGERLRAVSGNTLDHSAIGAGPSPS